MMNPSQPPMAPVCCLCQTVFQEPKVLPCLHTFCSNCLQTLAVTESQQKEVTCPTCGCFVTLPPSGVDGLKTNVFVKRLADLYFEEIRKSTQNEQRQSVEPDEGFADHSEVPELTLGAIPRSGTWHGQPTVTSMSSIVQSRSVNGDTTLSSLTTTPPPAVTPETGDTQEAIIHTEEEDHARIEMKKEACAITGKLTTKLMHLQGEALRLTYAIDTVNQSVSHWRDRNNEIKAQIQDRSLMLQHLIKTHEQKLLAEVDNLENHEQFLNEADRAKTELRGNLKRVLNAVQFLKQIQNFAHDEEVLEMKDFLLGDLKILTSVETSQKQYTLKLPSESSLDSLTNDFGTLTSEEKKSTVFDPDNGKAGIESGGMKLTQLEKVKQMEFTEASSSKMRRRRRAKTQQIRFSSPQGRKPSPQRRATRIITSEDRDMERSSPEKSSPESEESEDITDLQESLKQRRRVIIEEKKVEEVLGNIHDVQLLSVHRRPTREKKRRVQSFGGRASSRTRLMEQAAKDFRIQNEGEQHERKERKTNLGKAHSVEKASSFDSADGDEEIAHPQAGDDISTKMKYLHEKWRQRRELLRSSESQSRERVNQLSDSHSPNSPVSPTSPTDKSSESKFHMLRDQMSSIKVHFSPTDSQTTTSLYHSPSHKISSSPNSSTEFGSGVPGDTSVGSTPPPHTQQNGTSDKPECYEHVFSTGEQGLPGATDSMGLTRTKLMEIRANARKKKERWRSQTLS